MNYFFINILNKLYSNFKCKINTKINFVKSSLSFIYLLTFLCEKK